MVIKLFEESFLGMVLAKSKSSADGLGNKNYVSKFLKLPSGFLFLTGLKFVYILLVVLRTSVIG